MRVTPSFAQALTDEFTAKRRQYVLANTRWRWRVVGCGIVLLIGARLAGLTSVPWLFIASFAVVFGALNYTLGRVARDHSFRVWHAHANIALGAAMVSAVAYAARPSGELVFPAYLIAPFQAAYYLGPYEAWEALALSVSSFALVTALDPAAWGWMMFAKEALVLFFVAIAIIPTMLRIVARLRATREVLALVEYGDLTARAAEDEHDEIGYLAATVNRTIDATAQTLADAQRHASELDAVRPGADTPHGRSLAATAQRLSRIIGRFRVSDPKAQVVERGGPLSDSSGRSK